MLTQYRSHLSAFLTCAALLTSPVTTAGLSDQQSLFSSVEKSLKQGNNHSYLASRGALTNYPLASYLEYLYISNRLRETSQTDINRFVSHNPGLPHSSQLQYQWLNYLARNKRWSHYLAAYQKAGAPAGRYQCLKGIALQKLGRISEAWQEAGKLWLVGKSQNKACDPLFANWKRAGQLTQKKIYDRFWLAVNEGNTSLARYISRKLTFSPYKVTSELFWNVHNRPELLSTAHWLDGSQTHHRLILLHGIKRLSYKDMDKAIDAWLGLRERYPFTQKQQASINQRLALKVAKNFTDNASEQITRLDPDFQYPKVTQWHIRVALAKQDWSRVQELISRLPASDQQSSRWSYWNSVAELKASYGALSGHSAIRLQNHDTLSRLSQERNFYAFLVASLSRKPFQLNHEAPVILQKDLVVLQRKYPGFSRIKEWLHHNRHYSAQSELNRIFPQLNEQERKLVPYLAEQWEWHHQAIMSAAREALWNDLDLRFPSPQSHLFSKHARLRKLDYPWVLSIARQESAFNPRARSHAGARGLMQLMPATARQAARKHRIPYRRTSELYRPETNIALGTAHLAWLARRFDNSKVFATAAYNAGSTPVKRWLNDRGHLPLDIWIETIPYDETRNYVQNVLAFRVIYGSRTPYDAPIKMFSEHEVTNLALSAELPVLAQRD